MVVFIHTNYITVSFPLKWNIPFRIVSITGTYIILAASANGFPLTAVIQSITTGLSFIRCNNMV